MGFFRMVVSLEVLVLALLLVVPLYWSIPVSLAAPAAAGSAQVPAAWSGGDVGFMARQLLLIGFSLLLLFSLSPLIPAIIALAFGAVLLFRVAQRRGVSPDRLKPLSWGLFAPLAVVEFLPADMVVGGLFSERAAAVPTLVNWAYLGLSYCAIRSFLVLREAMNRSELDPLAALGCLTFFGSYVAGPICGSRPFTREMQAQTLTFEAALRAVCRIGWGAALLLVIAPKLAGLDLGGMTERAGLMAGQGVLAWLDLYRAFLVLYFDFAGYTSIAIGAALLFGITLPENFRMPLVSRSVQEFWQRWHMSLGAFIGSYLFKPIVRARGRPALAIFCAFVAVGLWHNVSWTYLFWGFGHGAALALQMILSKRMAAVVLPLPIRLLLPWAGWAFTMTYVSLLSAIANSSGPAAAVDLVLTLGGLGG